MTDIFAEREQYSRMRLAELRSRLESSPDVQAIPKLTIFCAGSYGRHEASPHSDIDLFFLYDGNRMDIDGPRTKELRLFGALIGIADYMKFPAFSNDSQYLQAMSTSNLLDDLGSPDDDANNHFTLRMLMILESKSLFGETVYAESLRQILDSYYRDYPDHQASFQPWFLLNDIGRFWKTLLLNYEHKRNQGELESAKTKQKVRNFKLKFSRMTTCFATVAAMSVHDRPITVDNLVELIALTPRQRLETVKDRHPSSAAIVDPILEEYSWFLEQTALSEPDLTSLFDDKGKRQDLFDRAKNYGTMMYGLLANIDADHGGTNSDFIRFLVI